MQNIPQHLAAFLDVDPITAFAPASPSAKLTIFQLNS